MVQIITSTISNQRRSERKNRAKQIRRKDGNESNPEGVLHSRLMHDTSTATNKHCSEYTLHHSCRNIHTSAEDRMSPLLCFTLLSSIQTQESQSLQESLKWNECSSPSDPTSQRSWNLAEPPHGSVTETATAPGEIPDAIVLSVEGQTGFRYRPLRYP